MKKAFLGGSWLALSRLVSQILTWAATILIARILMPQDYGLMEMATILTGYVILFSELGLGAALIQREDLKEDEINSLFWFMLTWGIFLGIICLFLAYPTVAIFNESRIFRITQSMSILFILASLMIIPINLIRRDLGFKKIGITEAIASISASTLMIIAAVLGAGVWTFVVGWISRELIKVIVYFAITKYKPKWHYNFNEIRAFLKFGLNLAAGNSLYYVYSKSDSFFAGRFLGSKILGYYSLALQLSSLPTDKLVGLINSVTYPVLARLQNDKDEFNGFYLKLTNLISFIVFPIFTGGIFVADELIPFVLGDKWSMIIFPFKLLCMAQIVISVTTINALAHTAQGRPNWNLYYNIASIFIFPLSFYFAAQYGLKYLVIPWITINPIVRSAFTYITLKKLDISKKNYLKAFLHPALATLCMSIVLILLNNFSLYFLNLLHIDHSIFLIINIMIGTGVYFGYFYKFDHSLFHSIRNLVRS